MRKEVLTWHDVDALIDHLIPQFDVAFEAMVMISRGGLVPGGLLAEALDITHLLLAAVDFPAQMAADRQRLVAWPQFIQFPAEHQLAERRVLIVDDVWGSGRTMTAVRARVEAAGATPYTCVLHFNPHRSLFGTLRPDFYAAITDAYIVYPWEIERGPDRILARPLGVG